MVLVFLLALLCFKHLKQEQYRKTCIPDNVEVEEQPGDNLDPDFTPEEISVPQETRDVSAEDGESITKLIDASPIKFQLKRNLSAIDDSTKKTVTLEVPTL